jgi:hypothetical protein
MNTALNEIKTAARPKRGATETERTAYSGIPLDENGVPIGHSIEEIEYELDQQLSEAYGVDFHKVTRMRESGELKEEELTNELLLSPAFKYEPYPGFKPAPPQKPANLDPEWEAAMHEILESFKNDTENPNSESEQKIEYANGKA